METQISLLMTTGNKKSTRQSHLINAEGQAIVNAFVYRQIVQYDEYSITAVRAVITRNLQLFAVNTGAVESHVGSSRAVGSIGPKQGRKCATEGKRNSP